MIQGTRQYRPRGQEESNPNEPKSPETVATQASSANTVNVEEIVPALSATENSLPKDESDAVNLERREWFQSIVPAFGDGLVKLLRASNNLQRDLSDAAKVGGEILSEREKLRREQLEK
jgi:hypothetical protein